MWVALVLVSVVGLSRLLPQPNESTTLSYLQKGKPFIVRSSGVSHRFPTLGVEVDVTNGWTYLSTRDDARAFTPTFVHPASRSIVRLQASKITVWPAGESNPEVEQYGENECQWIVLEQLRLGRLQTPPIDLAIVALTHEPHGNLNRQVRDFCAQIRAIEPFPGSATQRDKIGNLE